MSFTDERKNKIDKTASEPFLEETSPVGGTLSEEKMVDEKDAVSSGDTVKYNSEMVIEELARQEAGEKFANTRESRQNDYFGDEAVRSSKQVYEEELGKTAAMRRLAERERRQPLKCGYRPVTYSRRVFGYGPDEIPDADTQLTRRAKLNETRKVVSRAKKLEKSGKEGRVEPQCGEILTFEFDGISNAHIPLDNDTVFQIEGADGYSGQKQGRRPPATRGKKHKRGRRKKIYKRHGLAFRLVSVLLLMIIIFICIVGHDFAKKVCDDRAMDPANLSKIKYTVDEATSDEEVAAFLVENNMVENELYYKLRAILFEADYKPGTYELSPSYSTEKIINILSGYDYSAGK